MYVCIYMSINIYYVYFMYIYIYGNQYVYHNQLEHNSIVLIFL